jgi:hypothetical protein
METREKSAKSQQSRKGPPRPHDARMHHATAGEFYRVRVLRVLAADNMDTVDSIDLIAT